jgi:hypothetical protein
MKLYQLAIVLIVMVAFREVSGTVIMRLTGMGALANFGSLALASFAAGWLASSVGTRPPTDRQLGALAAMCVIACTAIGYIQGFSYLALAVVFILIVHTPISYVCLILGAKLAEAGAKKPPPRPEDGHEATPDA